MALWVIGDLGTRAGAHLLAGRPDVSTKDKHLDGDDD